MQGYAVTTHYHADGLITEHTYPAPYRSDYTAWLAAMSDHGWLHELDAFGPWPDHYIDILSRDRETIISTFHYNQ
jgi:hypothetical protein